MTKPDLPYQRHAEPKRNETRIARPAVIVIGIAPMILCDQLRPCALVLPDRSPTCLNPRSMTPSPSGPAKNDLICSHQLKLRQCALDLDWHAGTRSAKPNPVLTGPGVVIVIGIAPTACLLDHFAPMRPCGISPGFAVTRHAINQPYLTLILFIRSFDHHRNLRN